MRTRAVIHTSTYIQLRPSERLGQMIAILVCLAMLSVTQSGLTRLGQSGAMIILLVVACVRLGRLRRQRHRQLQIPWHAAFPVSVDGEQVQDFRLQWRGTIALLTWTSVDGHREWVQCWPDTVPIAQRRALSLAVLVRHVTRHSSFHRAPWCLLSV